MTQSLSAVFRDGQEYLKTWPVKRELYPLFPDCRVVAATKFGIKWMPPLCVLTVVISIYSLGNTYLPQAITMALFFISLPLQGLLWLGRRSGQNLPPSTRIWYNDIYQKMREQGCSLQRPISKPKYRDLAKLLKTAFDELDKVFTKQLF